MKKKFKYYYRRLRWLWQHRNCKDCRQKFRRMEREIRKIEQREQDELGRV